MSYRKKRTTIKSGTTVTKNFHSNTIPVLYINSNSFNLVSLVFELPRFNCIYNDLLSFGAGPLKVVLRGTNATFPISFGGLVNCEW